MTVGIIGFENHVVSCVIGTFSEEREREQMLLIDLKVEYDWSHCLQTGQLQDALNYLQLAELCTSFAQEKQHLLLESLAHDIAQAILQQFAVNWVWLKIKKPAALSSAEFTYVELRSTREQPWTGH